MSIYFISDTHFGDADIIRYENRPFGNTKQMDEYMIDQWNALVTNEDTVYHLGDVGYDDNFETMKAIINRLHGTKYLIKGNHDMQSNDFYRQAGFKEVYDTSIIIDGFFMLSHKPLYVNTNMPYANIFGDVHGNPSYQTTTARSRCVCVERTGFAPLSKERTYQSIQRDFDCMQTKEQFFEHQLKDGGNNQVLQFIYDILLHNGQQTSECTRNLFRNGYCYYFAHMLQTAFQRGTVCWAAPFGHFVWLDTSGVPYDIEGIYKGEAIELIPESYLGEAINDFRHIQNISYNATTKDIDAIIERYQKDKPSKYAEIRSNHTDENEQVTYIDAWKTDNDNEEGTVIAKIHHDSKEVEYIDPDAKTDRMAQEEIQSILTSL